MPAVTPKVTLLSCTPKALAVVYAACRQCYASGSATDMFSEALVEYIPTEKQEELVRRVIASGHESPLEHVTFTFAIEGVSRAMSHQLVRHRIASFSQQSQRYVDSENFDYVVPPSVARNPQALEHFENLMKELGEQYRKLKEFIEQDGLDASKSREDARFILPQATATKLVFTMNARELRHFFTQRCCYRAQWEIRAVANSMLDACRRAFPAVFDDAGPECERTHRCPEGSFSCGRYPTD
ncbi:MAG: FAD-dependent thymidylate synthase [Desulfovibrionaceae bacterium]|nr:FAD-dependent thymidylate synthase [Desulfovibrionaceae bacterium]